MDMDADFEDEFDDVAGAQPSGAIPLEQAPELTGGAWYDFEDEMPGDNSVQSAAYYGARPVLMRQNMRRPAPIRQNSWSTQDSSSFPVAAAARALRTSSRWRNVFSLRSILILLVLLGVVGGIIFGRGLILPATRSGTHVVRPEPRAQPTPTGTLKPPSTPAPALPLAWTASGRGGADLLEALSVAETFTQRYETIDFRSPATLSAARPLLTQAADLRFSDNDERSSDQLAQLIQQEQLVQVAFITGAKLVAAQEQYGNFFAWATVSFRLAMQQGTGGTPPLQRQMTILLVAIPFGTPQGAAPMGGIGWLVSSYSAGNTLPPIPAQP